MVDCYCSQCRALRQSKPTKDGTPRLPRNWQRFKDEIWCDTCWHAAFKLRAVSIPVRMMTPELWAVLREAWNACRAVANASVLALLKDDVVRNGQAKMPAPPKTYLYPVGRAAAPELSPRSVVSVTHAVQGRYNRQRWDVLWRGAASPPLYRRYPVPIPPDSFDIRHDDDGWHVLSVRLGGEWRDFRLDRSAGSQRGLAALRQIMAGEAKGVEASLLCKVAHVGDHRARKWEVMAKVVSWLPRGEKQNATCGPLDVCTASDVFMRVLHAGWSDPRNIQADHVRTWIVGHTAMLGRIKERPQGREHKRREYRVRCDKYRNRIDSFVKMTAAQLRRWAQQSRASEIRYDDSVRDYLPSFAWDKLRQSIALACDDLGITYTLAASGEVVDEIHGTAREE